MENKISQTAESAYALNQAFELRRQALYMAQDINRSIVAPDGSFTPIPTAEKIISDADKFYEWLTKSLQQ